MDAPLAWHARTKEEALAGFESTPQGLSGEEAARRLAEHGPNRLPPPKKRGPLLRFLAQFHNVLIYVLLAAVAVTAALGHYVDSGVILAVVLANTVIGFFQEGKAEAALTGESVAVEKDVAPVATEGMVGLAPPRAALNQNFSGRSTSTSLQ
jgi:magnesium-transporting ATPase (P-type)